MMTSVNVSSVENKVQPFVVGDFATDGTCLGSGQFGNVLLGQRITDGTLVAMKVIKQDAIERSNAPNALRKQLQREQDILLKSRDIQNVVHVHAILNHPITNEVVIVMEYCDGGDLESWITRIKRLAPNALNEDNARYFISQIARALAQLSILGILHRDLKVGCLLLYFCVFDLITPLFLHTTACEYFIEKSSSSCAQCRQKK